LKENKFREDEALVLIPYPETELSFVVSEGTIGIVLGPIEYQVQQQQQQQQQQHP